MPFPRLEATPPVTKMNFVCSGTSEFDSTRARHPSVGPTPNRPRADFAVVAYDTATGTQQWVARFDGGSYYWALDVVSAPDGSAF